jgi:3-oxoacyl-[acyl-carrier protein] reductase
MRNYMDLSGRTALITGASSGIGAATARVFAELGASVAIGYHGNQSGADATRDAIRAAGGTAISLKADVRDSAQVRALVDDATAQLGPLDILVNNAGSLIQRFSVREVDEARFDEIYTLNVKSAVMAAKAVSPSMVERRRGAIINIVSVAGHTGGGPGAGIYASAKAALGAYTKSLAKELAPFGVRANAVAPGVIDTPFHEAFSTAEMMKNFVSMIPVGRVGRSEECATVIAFLASDAASFIVGETIDVNGGQLMR